jgi:SAM-dependent methyltransferase
MTAFLEDVLGLTVIRRSAEMTALRAADGAGVEVFAAGDPDPRPHFTTGPVVGFLVDDLHRARERVARAGIELIGEPGWLDDGTAWQCFRGPDGAVYALKVDPSVVVEGAPAAPAAQPDGGEADGPMEPIAFYDDADIAARYRSARGQPDEPNVTLEEPHVWRFLGGVRGCRALDLGCGEARMAVELLDRGAASYLGLDGSRRMVERAAGRLQGRAAAVRLADLETWEGEPGERFDLVVSRMAVHYVRDLGRLLRAVRGACVAGARVVLSTEHPVVSSSYLGDYLEGIPRSWSVRRYFDEGDRSCEWLGTTVRKQHRTLETYIHLLAEAGFQLRDLSEGRPEPASFHDQEVCGRRREVPMYLVMAATAV